MVKKGLGGRPYGTRMKTVIISNKVQQEIIDDSDSDDLTPGPGAYFNPQLETSKNFKINVYQHFGSSTSRFK